MRQEFNQMKWLTNQQNCKAFISIAIVLALYCFVGWLELRA